MIDPAPIDTISTQKICVLTGTRAEYGLLRELMHQIDQSDRFRLQVIATGAHLSPEFGSTYREIEADGFRIDRKVEMLVSSDTPTGISKSTALGIIGIADALDQLKPDLLVLLGDRFELLSAAIAGMNAKVPIAHLHGGESSEGAIDECIRHSITKMSHLHFVAAEPYRQRVIQLGESPDRVHLVGGLGVDGIRRSKLLSRDDLQQQLGIELAAHNLIITYHPVTLEHNTASEQFKALLDSLSMLGQDIRLIFTKPNADADGRVICDLIDQYAAAHPSTASAFTSLGQLRYWSALQYVDAVVGNSSSGLLEAPSFGIPTVNIGDRQLGRLQADSVIQCSPESNSISSALKRALDPAFQSQCRLTSNPYGNGDAVEKIMSVLHQATIDERLLKKQFYNVTNQ
ncbi:UDP-N-acetylglucosamine 2-epimerase [Rubripirellula lacrimiformis]|nr:UDP-N-acetylglucosamine 2-epimerase [Rubripirellula lacrimiformis]